MGPVDSTEHAVDLPTRDTLFRPHDSGM